VVCRQEGGCAAVAKAASAFQAIPSIGVEFWIRRAQLLASHCASTNFAKTKSQWPSRAGCACTWKTLEGVYEAAVVAHGSSSVELWLEWITARRRQGVFGHRLLERAISTLEGSLADELVRSVRG
jgi:hypothetical protein